MKREITIKRLRAEHPSWTWRAHHVDFGRYIYSGARGAERVRVEPRAARASQFEDDFVTIWLVYDRRDKNRPSEPYHTWTYRQQMPVK